jgi:hypothetical protein
MTLTSRLLCYRLIALEIRRQMGIAPSLRCDRGPDDRNCELQVQFQPDGPVAESVLFRHAASHSGCGVFCVSS